jgi:hypothetical protein
MGFIMGKLEVRNKMIVLQLMYSLAPCLWVAYIHFWSWKSSDGVFNVSELVVCLCLHSYLTWCFHNQWHVSQPFLPLQPTCKWVVSRLIIFITWKQQRWESSSHFPISAQIFALMIFYALNNPWRQRQLSSPHTILKHFRHFKGESEDRSEDNSRYMLSIRQGFRQRMCPPRVNLIGHLALG